MKLRSKEKSRIKAERIKLKLFKKLRKVLT